MALGIGFLEITISGDYAPRIAFLEIAILEIAILEIELLGATLQKTTHSPGSADLGAKTIAGAYHLSSEITAPY